MSRGQLTLDIEIPIDQIEQLMEDEGLMQPVEAGFSAEYASDVEYGRPPGSNPPIEPLFVWTRRKLNITDKERALERAYEIQEKIFEKGTRPQPYFTPAVNKVRSELNKVDISKEGMYAISDRIVSEAQKIIEDKGITDRGGLVISGYSRRKL